MKGRISLKDFIIGVKKELQEAASEGSKNPFLELTQVELDAEFSLEAKTSAEGGFWIFAKASGEAGASQAHKVKMIFSPINNTVAFAVPPPDNPQGTNLKEPSGPGLSKPHSPYFFVTQGYGIDPMKDIVNDMVRKAIRNQKGHSQSRPSKRRG